MTNPEFGSNPEQVVEKKENVELSRELDELSARASNEVYQIDTAIEGRELSEPGPLTQKYKEMASFLEGKTPEDLKGVLDPQDKFNPAEFSHFELRTDLPGAIHLELGSSADLAKFREILNQDKGSLLKLAGIGDQREVELFAAQYYPPKVFAEGNYLGVIITIREHNQDEQTRQGSLRHEYSHAIMQQVVRPLHHRTVVNIGLGDRLREIQQTVEDMGPEKAAKLAEALGIAPDPETREHMKSLVIAKDIYDEQYLLDELRAYTYNAGPLPPKRQISDLELEGEDSPQSAKVETVRKYFRVNLLHTKARIISKEARARSLAVLGSSLSLEQARRLLEQSAAEWKFDETEDNDAVERKLRTFNLILNDPEYKHYRDFNHQQGGELLSQAEMREILLPDKQLVDQEIVRRYGSVDQAPQTLQDNYKNLYQG